MVVAAALSSFHHFPAVKAPPHMSIAFYASCAITAMASVVASSSMFATPWGPWLFN